MRKFLIFMLTVLPLLTFVACSDDDSTSDPADTVTLNMMNESNGKTVLENSGVFINKAHNFQVDSYGRSGLLAAGKVANLGAISTSSFNNLVSQVAVEQGNGYIIVRDAALRRFPSGAVAISISPYVNYIKMQVLSNIMVEDKVAGAAVKYAFATPETYGLPTYDSEVINLISGEQVGERVVISLPTSDFEYELEDPMFLECKKSGSQLILTVPYNQGRVALYLRIRESYTQVYINVR